MIKNVIQTCTVPETSHGQRLDLVLAQLLPEYSRSQLTNWIKEGLILLNNKTCKPKDKAQVGDILTIEVTFTPIVNDFKSCLPEEIALDCIYEDDDILIINKQAGLVVHPGAGNPNHTLVNALLHHAPDLAHLPRAGIIHRLDKDTTGLLIVAKSLPAHFSLIQQMQERTIQRHYLALVHGHVTRGETLTTGFARHSKNRLKMAVSGQGRQAITTYAVSKPYLDFTLLDVKLETGRTHQIRVHMAHINHPVVGDPLYGKPVRAPNYAHETLKIRLKEFKRQALHAYTLHFLHPITQIPLTFKAPIPDDFKLLLEALDETLD
jgi:23S rRNA pseudouridine1911/1915/1917 synthase